MSIKSQKACLIEKFYFGRSKTMSKLTVRSTICIVLIISIFGSCGLIKSKKDSKKLIFVGIDALDWEMLDQLIPKGTVPNFQRLKQQGTSAQVNTNDKGGSAVYWTTIATGQLSSKHGIRNFIIRDPTTKEMIPVTSNIRRSKAFWNIFTENDISVGVVGWYVSWPAEEVNGFMISSYFAIKDTEQLTWKGTIYENTPHMVYPDELQEEVDGYIRTAKERYLRNLGKIIKPSALDKDMGIVHQTKWAFISDEIFHEIGLNLYHKKKPQVFAVYFEGMDVVGHRFTFPKKPKQIRYNRQFGNVQENYYLYMDDILSQYLKAADKNTCIILAADHGLMRGHHTNNGVFIIAGPGIKKNVKSSKTINLTDMLPTMLYIMGLPIAKDMDGEPFLEAFQEKFLAANEVQYINTYGRRKAAAETPRKSQFDEEILERLRSLGYIK
jgi:predicted AlkP superfamily phosphohydrolase/phosphomutase